jgi:hypothetical protein
MAIEITATHVSAEEITPVLNALTAILDNRTQALQGVVIANLIAIFALNCEGSDPYYIAHQIHKHAKKNIKSNLDAMGILTALPKGAKAN